MNKYINEIVDSNNKNGDYYVIFYSPWCSFSMKAMDLLRDRNIKHKSFIIDEISDDISELLKLFIENKDKLAFNTSHRTRPIIFKNGKFLGGYTELAQDLLENKQSITQKGGNNKHARQRVYRISINYRRMIF